MRYSVRETGRVLTLIRGFKKCEYNLVYYGLQSSNDETLSNRVKKFSLEQAMKAQRGSRGIALLFL
jgi:predicted component of type VI protein secretion system